MESALRVSKKRIFFISEKGGRQQMINLYIRLFWKQNWKKYIPVVILILIQCQTFRNILQGYESYFGIQFEVSAGDYIADFCKGTIPYTMGGSQEPFNIPAIWSLFYIYFF